MDLKDLIYISKGAISVAQCEFLIEEFARHRSSIYFERCYESNTGEMRRSTVQILALEPESEAFRIAHDKTNAAIREYQSYLESFNAFFVAGYINSLAFSHRYRLMEYDVGQSIHDHVDAGPHIHGSCTLALNDDYDGGSFRFFRGHHKFRLERGDVMIWPANCFFTHGVEPVSRGKRYSCNSFLCLEPGVLDKENRFAYHHDATLSSTQLLARGLKPGSDARQ